MRALWIFAFCVAGGVVTRAQIDIRDCSLKLNDDINKANSAFTTYDKDRLICRAHQDHVKCVERVLPDTTTEMRDRTQQQFDRMVKDRNEKCGRAATATVTPFLLAFLLAVAVIVGQRGGGPLF